MPGSVGQFFLRNWLLKLAALFFAVMLYVAVAAQQPLTETFALRLSVAPPPGRALRQAPPSIAVTIQGKGSEILKLRNIPRTISKTVPDTLTGSLWRLHLSPGDVTLPKGGEGVQVGDISPPDVDIVVDSAARRGGRIAPRVTLENDPGFAGWELVSERVQVSVGGPAARVERLTRDSLRVVAHLVRPGGPGGYARLSVQAPTGINARAIPDSVALKRKGGRRG